ncbi:MAG: hypothetical protein WCF81_18105 [Roseiarcus sp.]
MSPEPRGERLQIMLTSEEFTALDRWRFSRHMPSRAAAVRELLRRGLAAEGFDVSDGKMKSADFGVIGDMDAVGDKKP